MSQNPQKIFLAKSTEAIRKLNFQSRVGMLLKKGTKDELSARILSLSTKLNMTAVAQKAQSSA